jgi:hypothetical protein
METSQIFIENCNNISDKIYDTVRVSLDSSVSFAAIEKIQNYYDTVYSRMQVDMSNIIMVFSFILGLFTICLGVKFVWDAFVAKKWYSDREKILNNIFDAKVKEIQRDFSNLKDSYVLDSILLLKTVTDIVSVKGTCSKLTVIVVVPLDIAVIVPSTTEIILES